jgi:hypothetical protein
MQWWTNFVDWFSSDDGWRITSGAIIPFVAIVVAGVIAAGIGRASTRRVLAVSDRDHRAAAVTALLTAARRASVWNTLSAPEQRQADQVASEADIRLRLLSIPGAGLASEWTTHEIAEMKKDSISFSFQAEQTLLVVRERLIEWQAKPGRAKKLFKNDLDSWAYESSLSDKELIHQQQAWAAQEASSAGDTAAAPAHDDGLFSPPVTSSAIPSTPVTGIPASDATATGVVETTPVSSSSVSKRINPSDDDA